MEEEDDLYGQQVASKANGNTEATIDPDDEGDDIEEDSDSDIDIITERKPTSTKPEATSQPPSARLEPPKADHTRSASTSDDKGGAASAKQPTQSSTPQPQAAQKFSAPQSSKPGSDYPAVHTSKLDIDSTDANNPVYDPLGKPLTDVDFDADLAEHTKPWRLPGTDQTDYFNYGFDEFTWATYCIRQRTMRDGIEAQKAESAKFEMMFGAPGGGMPGMPGQPPSAQGQAQGQQGQPGQQGGGQQSQVPQGMPPMPGMPEMTPEMMNGVMQQMMVSGIDPTQMDLGTFMQQFQAMQQGGMGGGPGMGGQGGMGVPSQGPQQQQGRGGGGGGGGGGGRRSGRRW